MLSGGGGGVKEDRLLILEEAFAPGAIVTQVARRYDVSTALIYTWRRKLQDACAQPMPPASADQGFAEALLIEGSEAAGATAVPAIVIDLGRGKRVSIFASAPPALATATLRALR